MFHFWISGMDQTLLLSSWNRSRSRWQGLLPVGWPSPWCYLVDFSSNFGSNFTHIFQTYLMLSGSVCIQGPIRNGSFRIVSLQVRKGHNVRHRSLPSRSVWIGQVPTIYRMSTTKNEGGTFFSKVRKKFQSLCIVELKFHGQGRLNSDISTNLQMERFHHQISYFALRILQFNLLDSLTPLFFGRSRVISCSRNNA